MRTLHAPRRLAGLLLATALLGCGGGGPDPEPEAEPPLLLPDGRTRGSVDFALDAATLAASLEVVDRTFLAEDCAVVEGTISGPGTRRLLRFDTRIANLGELDLHIGSPGAPLPPLDPSDFEFHGCHGHHHLHGYAAYELRTAAGAPAAAGVKQGFCLLDGVPAHPAAQPARYDCDDQGLSSGWSDLYVRTLDGQWIDVTGLPGGAYVLRVTINAEGNLPEAVDHHPNAAEVAVELPDPSTPVPVPDDHADQATQGTLLAFPSAIAAVLAPADDRDWFHVRVRAGTAYVFRTTLLTLPDSLLRLTTPTGAVELASSDDVAPGSDASSRIEWTATYTGTVALEVSGPGGATGGYRIVVE